MASGIALPITTERVLSSYQDCLAAFLNRDLARTFDKRSYEQGNVRQGNVSTLHGTAHRDRRRIENPLFRSERLELYERRLFPEVIDRLLDRLIGGSSIDLLIASEQLSLVLSAHRAGIDIDPDDLATLEELVEFINRFSQGSAIIDTVGDADAVRAMVMKAMADWEATFLAPSRQRREMMLERWRAGELDESELPNDVLTLLLRHLDDSSLGLTDGIIARETATYLHGGAHTSSQTLVNTTDMLLTTFGPDSDVWQRVVDDRAFAQRCVHETLRLRPTTPRLKRRAEVATRVGEIDIPEAALVLIDVATANKDPQMFGADPERFDPDRTIDDRAKRWGLTFGAGPHQCPGRNVAVGLPLDEVEPVGDRHLFGLVSIMLQGVAEMGPRRDPDNPPVRDERTVRWTRWNTYPVVFANPRGAL